MPSFPSVVCNLMKCGFKVETGLNTAEPLHMADGRYTLLAPEFPSSPAVGLPSLGSFL